MAKKHYMLVIPQYENFYITKYINLDYVHDLYLIMFALMN